MKVLVTGSSGHLGDALVRTLQEMSHEVVGLDVTGSAFTSKAVDLDLDALKANADRIVLLAGRESRGYPSYEVNVELGKKLGRELIELPAGHIGFNSQPAEFARQFVQALAHTGHGRDSRLASMLGAIVRFVVSLSCAIPASNRLAQALLTEVPFMPELNELNPT